MKKTFVSTLMALLLILVATSAMFAAPREKDLLLKGSIQSLETYVVNFPIMWGDRKWFWQCYTTGQVYGSLYRPGEPVAQ